MSNDVVIVGAVRTPIGEFGGSLRKMAPAGLGAAVIRALLTRTGVSGEDIGQAVFGNVLQTTPRDMYLGRLAALSGGVAPHAGALTVNRLGGSGLEAVLLAAHYVASGEAEIAVGGGAETMSLAPQLLPISPPGTPPGEAVVADTLLRGFTDPMTGVRIGELGERIAARFKISRQRQDAIALSSHRRAAHAAAAGYFDTQIVPVDTGASDKAVTFTRDERVRAAVTPGYFAKFKPIFRQDGGTITAANASGFNDGAAAVLMTTARHARFHELRPMARLIAHARVGVMPEDMGIAPVIATREVLRRAELRIHRMDVIELNEVFASDVGAFLREMAIDDTRVNPNGGAIALGHPVGATGAIMVTKAVHELQRTGARYALVTTCVGGGQGIAAIFERI
ncbi:acetyl-CoA C-acyltransferase [Pandoraea pnomenusa]|uniref:acetyl-CoA C-acyltransferase n=1 Tax=Pandoraea pnomenusa TaxID=93220 RepID=UPI003341B6FB